MCHILFCKKCGGSQPGEEGQVCARQEVEVSICQRRPLVAVTYSYNNKTNVLAFLNNYHFGFSNENKQT